MTAPSDFATDLSSGAWLRPRKPIRLALAALLAAPVAGGILALVLGLTVMNGAVFQMENPAQPSNLIPADLGAILSNLAFLISAGFMLGGMIGWPATLVIALPGHAWLIRKTSGQVYWYAGLGLAAGVAAAAAYMAGAGSTGPVSLLVYGASGGMVAGCIFWLIRRPDADG